ncbi:MAG: HigA family addiction module antidote protein [Alphaproteobacteria bacterium]|nr:HigA family addiction module antidote protein [Alphaproteobacteria bacterium]
MVIAATTPIELDDITTGERLDPVHPGVILNEEFLRPLRMSGAALAVAISVPRNRVSMILKGERAMTSDTALRLGRYFGTTAAFWMNLQSAYDLEITERTHGAAIDSVIDPFDWKAMSA